ncbi:Hypothetical predicted protein [Xyrichtys novacula]|uniref:Uncharacterized protein n=1 Tax=Xyrichtys novacula TaxID=13765 RepID=A0AAV1G2V7_XYRNO|nr:Hypothetical predicted protein [Xyrichtys novacula]
MDRERVFRLVFTYLDCRCRFLPLHPGPGRGGSSFRREVQTALTSATPTSSSSFRGDSQALPGQERYNPSTWSWADHEVPSHSGRRKKPEKVLETESCGAPGLKVCDLF